MNHPHTTHRHTTPLLTLLLTLLTLHLTPQPTQAQIFKDPNTQKIVNTLRQHIKLSGYLQTTYTLTPQENTFELKRAIIMADGQITPHWRLYYMFDFKGAKTLEAYAEYKINDALTIRLGQYKNPFSIENQISPTLVEQIESYSLVSNYLVLGGGDPLYGSQTGRDQGLMIHGNLINRGTYHALTYKLALMNGQGINAKDRNQKKDLIATLAYKPIQQATLSASISEGRGNALAASPYNPTITPGTDYRRARWSAGAQIQTHIADLRTEYMAGRDASVRSQGYYLTANLHLTTQLDLIASYDHLQRNKDMGDAATETDYIGGLQYWFYPQCRLQLVYTYRHNPHDPNQEGGNRLQAQIQVRF